MSTIEIRITVDEHGRYGRQYLLSCDEEDDLPRDPGSFGANLKAGTTHGSIYIEHIHTCIHTGQPGDANYVYLDLEIEREAS